MALPVSYPTTLKTVVQPRQFLDRYALVFGGAASILLAKVHNGTLLPFAIITSCALILGLVVSYRLDLRPIEEIRASEIT